MSYLLILLTTLILAGCNSSPSTPQAAIQDTYQDYPCYPDCQAFQKGYDQAAAQKITTPENCPDSSFPETTGCKAYVNEYRFEHRANDLLLKNP